MSFKRFVETGRVAYIVHGPNKGKLCSIVDVIDQTRVLVDGPLTGVVRQGIRIKQINLTKFVLKFPRSGGTGIVRKAWKEGKIDEKWSKSRWAKNLANKRKRLAMTDFDRYRLRSAIRKRNKIRSEAYYKLKKQACRKNRLYGMRKTKKTDEMRAAAMAKALVRMKKRRERKKQREEEEKAKGEDGKAPKAEKSASKQRAEKPAPKEKAEKPAAKAKAEKPAPKEKAEKSKEKPAPKK